MKTLDLHAQKMSSYGITNTNVNLTSGLSGRISPAPIKGQRFLNEGKSDEYSSAQNTGTNYLERKSDIAERMQNSVSLNNKKRESAGVNFGGFFNSKSVHKALLYASDNGALLGATISAIMGGVLKPLAILTLPGVDKENKQYACTKSLSSSLIGVGIMYLVTKPLKSGLKLIHNNPTKYLKESTIKRLKNSGKDLTNSSKYMFATKLFTLGPDFAFAIPKALLTVALIPPIMSLLFSKKVMTKESKNSDFTIQFKGNSTVNDKKALEIYKDFIGDKNEHK